MSAISRLRCCLNWSMVLAVVAGLTTGFALDLGLGTPPETAGALGIASACLLLWLLEVVPPFVPTLLLLALVPLVASADPRYKLQPLLTAAADPVLALFFGGFALALAASRHGLDRLLAARIATIAGQGSGLVLASASATAFLSMWMSNLAATAMMLGAIQPMLSDLPAGARRRLLLGIAFAANLGGMATPVGTGPNAIAMSTLAHHGQHFSFLGWMLVAVPLTLVLLAVVLGLILWLHRLPAAEATVPPALGQGQDPPTMGQGGRTVLLIAAGVVVLWLTEPWHGHPASTCALLGAAALFVAGSLRREDLRAIDWSTLLLISGGLVLGKILETSGLLTQAGQALPLDELPGFLSITLLAFLAATLSALMSNTATAALILPLAWELSPHVGTVLAVALGCSLGCPFTISTPPNAMVHGQGGIRFRDLFWPGLAAMLIGSLLLAGLAPWLP